MNNLVGVLIRFRKNKIALVDLCPGPPAVESLGLTDLVSGCLATGSHALADVGPELPAASPLALADSWSWSPRSLGPLPWLTSVLVPLLLGLLPILILIPQLLCFCYS